MCRKPVKFIKERWMNTEHPRIKTKCHSGKDFRRCAYKHISTRDSIQWEGRILPIGCISFIYFNESVSAGYLSPVSQKDLRRSH